MIRIQLLLATLFLLADPLAGQAQILSLPVKTEAGSAITRRAALVIGNAAYEHHPLTNPVHDADGVAAALRRLGFTVTEKTNLKREDMVAAVNQWSDTLDEHTLALVYFSGHGIGCEGANYLVPINNGGIKKKPLVPDMACSLRLLMDTTKKCPISLFILDACSYDPFPDQDPKGGGDTEKTGTVAVSLARGRFFAYATQFGETASDNSDGKYSLYTEALLNNIETPGLSIEQVFNRVRGEVMQKSQNHQVPEERSQLVGELCVDGSAPSARDLNRMSKTDAGKDYIGNANEAYGAKKYELAEANFTFALEVDPNNEAAYVGRANAYANQMLYDRAVLDYTQAIDLKPDYAVAYYDRASSYFHLKQYDKAIADFSQAIRFKPDDLEAYANRGLAYAGLNQFDRALSDFSQALQWKPDAAEIYTNRGLAYSQQNLLDKALEDYARAIRLKPDDAETYSNRGLVYIAQKKYDKALADCDQALRLNPDLAEAYVGRGIACCGLNQYNRAIEDFSKAIQRKPNLAETYFLRGAAYDAQEQYDKALADYRKYLKPTPDAPYIEIVRRRIAELEKPLLK